jgi:hypothetical protein
VEGEDVLYFAAPLFGAYRDHDYWVYMEVVNTLYEQPAGDDHPERRIVYRVAYHPRRTTQPVQHVNQSWPTSGLGVDVLTDGRTIGRVYLALGGEPLDFEEVDGYARIALPPVGAHTVVVVE